MTASSRSGTARVRASTAPATSSATPTSPARRSHGGVLALMGDDHTAESSTNAHATEFLFVDTMIPILNPAGVQELIDYGLYGYALSRFAGTWAAIKCVKDNIESTASVDASLDRLNIVAAGFRHAARRAQHPPRDRLHRPGGAAARVQARRRRRLHPRQRPQPHRLFRRPASRRSASSRSARAIWTSARRSTTSASTSEQANQIGVRLFKVGCPWPLDIEHIKDFARGLEMIVVVEEKRSLIEVQVREDLYGTAMQPLVVGKKDERGDWLFPAKGALDPNDIAIALGERVLKVIGPSEEIAARVEPAQAISGDAGRCQADIGPRTPFFCSGCPHNSSTKVPEGSIAGAGIGCHFMALWMDRVDRRLHPDGRRGRAVDRPGAVLEARAHLPEPRRRHLQPFRRRWRSVSRSSTGANITYKILYNDAVAMTGGQPHEGGLTVDMIARQVRAEGVERIAVVSDEPGKYGTARSFRRRTTFHHRDDLDLVQRDLREVQGRLGAALRPDLRGGKAPPAQARHVPGSRQARRHQRTRLRRLRRLRRAVELRLDPAGGDRIRPQAPHRPVELQQGFLLPQRLLPVLRHRARRKDPQGGRGSPARPIRWRACRSRGSFRSTRMAGRRSSTASAAPAS